MSVLWKSIYFPISITPSVATFTTFPAHQFPEAPVARRAELIVPDVILPASRFGILAAPNVPAVIILAFAVTFCKTLELFITDVSPISKPPLFMSILP